LKKGRVRVERRNPREGIIALSQGLEIPIADIYKETER
jgi:hypothetical protein